jgi:hypothetical protein
MQAFLFGLTPEPLPAKHDHDTRGAKVILSPRDHEWTVGYDS